MDSLHSVLRTIRGETKARRDHLAVFREFLGHLDRIGRTSRGLKNKSAKSDEEPWETFVPKEDTPDAGDIPYRNNTIHPNTLQFLRGKSVLSGADC